MVWGCLLGTRVGRQGGSSTQYQRGDIRASQRGRKTAKRRAERSQPLKQRLSSDVESKHIKDALPEVSANSELKNLCLELGGAVVAWTMSTFREAGDPDDGKSLRLGV